MFTLFLMKRQKLWATVPYKKSLLKSPPISPLHDPETLCGLVLAGKRIQQAIEKKEKIMVFGDFDADGVTATAILVDALRRLGGLVSYRIPDRVQDSHGLKTHLIDEIVESGANLLITVDCGINDVAAVDHARERGLAVIITDHHQPDTDKLLPALAVLNPHRADCPYPEKNLSGAGVVFKLVQYLAGDIEGFCEKYLDILAIGMIADCMPLTGEVRTLVKQGLNQIKTTQWPGLRELFTQLKLDPKNINEETIGFYIAPVINAASRVGNVQHAVQLFLGQGNHAERVEYLLQLNDQRKDWSRQAHQESLEQTESTTPYQLLITETWPIGILGLVAGKLCEDLGQPVIVMRREGEVYKASCRSPEWANIEQALRPVSDLFITMGGHPAAAGFMLPVENLDLLKTHLNTHYRELESSPESVGTAIEITPDQLNFDLVNEVESGSPYGIGHPAPVLCLRQVRVMDFKFLGTEKNHLKLTLQAGEKVFTGMMFHTSDCPANVGDMVSVFFTLRDQYWRGDRQLQLKLMELTTL